MDCTECGSPTIAYAIPAVYKPLLPGSESGAATCTRCLALLPVDDPPEEEPDFQEISDAFPSTVEAALPMALALGLLSSLALYRSEISTLLEAVEHAGADPMLVVDRLASDPDVQSHVDLDGRRRQLEQLV